MGIHTGIGGRQCKSQPASESEGRCYCLHQLMQLPFRLQQGAPDVMVLPDRVSSTSTYGGLAARLPMMDSQGVRWRSPSKLNCTCGPSK